MFNPVAPKFFTHVGWGAFVNRGARNALTNTSTAAGSASGSSAAGSTGWNAGGRSFYQLTNLANPNATGSNAQSSTDEDDNRKKRPTSRLRRKPYSTNKNELGVRRRRHSISSLRGEEPIISLQSPIVQGHLRRAFSTSVSASTPSSPAVKSSELPTAAPLPAPRPRRHSTSSIAPPQRNASSRPPAPRRTTQEVNEAKQITATYASELNRLVKLNPDGAREQVHRLVFEYRAQPHASVEAHFAAFKALLHIRQPGRSLNEAFALFDEMPRRDMRWSAETLELAIETLCAREREIDGHLACLTGQPGAVVPSWLAVQHVEHLWRDRDHLLASELGAEMAALKAEAPLQRALDLYFTHWRSLRTATANALLAECAARAQVDTEARFDTIGERILASLTASTVASPSAMTYVHLISIYRARDDKVAVLKTFAAMKEAKLDTSSEADATFGRHHIQPFRSHAIPLPVPAGYEIPRELDTPEQLAWAGVIGTLFDVDEPTEGLVWLEKMISNEGGITAGSNALLEVITGFARLGDIETARSWLARTKEHESVYVPIANAVLSELRKVEELNAVLVDVSEVARERGFKYDAARWSPTVVEANLFAFDRADTREERTSRLLQLEALKIRFAEDQARGHTVESIAPTPALSLRLIRALATVDLREKAAATYDDLVRQTWSTLTPSALPLLDSNTVNERRSLLRDGAYAAAGVSEDGERLLVEAESTALSLDSAIKICRGLWAIDLRPTGALASLVAHLYITAKMEDKLPTTFTAADWPLVVDACAVALFSGEVVEERHRRVFDLLVEDVAVAGISLEMMPTFAWTAATMHEALGVEVAAPLLGRLTGRPFACVDEARSPLTQGSVSNIAGLVSPTLAEWTPPSSLLLTPPPYLEALPDRQPTPPPGQTYDDELTLHILTTLPKHRDQVYKAVEEALADNRCPHPMALAKLIDALANDPGRNARSLRRGQIERLYMVAYDSLALFPDVEGTQTQMTSWAQLEDSMLQAMAHLGDLEHVALHRDRLLAAGCTPSADAFATMILNMRDTTDDASVAVETFTEARRLGVRPNAFLYNTLISRLSRARRATDALMYFDEMRRSGVEPTAVTFGSVINACCKTGDEHRARQLFDEMTAAPGYIPRHPPFNTMIQFFQTKGDRPSALHYFDRMIKAKIPLTDHTYRLLIDTYGVISPVDPASALDVFRLLERDQHVAVQGMHWAALITMYGVQLGDGDKVTQVFDSISTHASKPSPPTAQPDPLVYEALFNALWACGRKQDVERYRQEMQRAGAQMTAYTANALIKGYGANGDIEAARAVFDSLEDPKTGVAGHSAHHGHSRSHPEPSRSRMLPTDHVYREPSTYEALIIAEKAAGETGRAEALYERAVRRAFPAAVTERMRKALEA